MRNEILNQAEQEVEFHRRKVEEGLERLEEKLRAASAGVKGALDRAVEQAHSPGKAMTESSPISNLGVFLTAGYLLGTYLADRRAARRDGRWRASYNPAPEPEPPADTALPPIAGEGL